MDLLFYKDAYQKSCDATVTYSENGQVRLDQTLFYPTGGGQPGDSGWLELSDGTKSSVIEARKGESHEDVVLHLEEGALAPQVGSTVTAFLDWDRRYAHMKIHSCLHLLCASVIGDVSGGQISDVKGRLDFNLPDTAIDKVALEDKINQLISENHPITQDWISDEELDNNPSMVRTMSVKPPRGSGKIRLVKIGEDVDLQPCGGTHVKSTGEIGPIKIGKVENKGKQNRRINLTFAS
ncbi:Ala-tRNA(Pro) hydrolase [Kiloniella spongiae]|uniref:Alanine--tRNA ligase n=1 Tax=Kiloniella spongiae TaxID=1489064 RepID=A0A0H2MH21_9PROT|nr:alanyl-tRNA editing protein [Kiloniella spongiae]KLN61461.1 Ala-tRNA(Pro) hydrolase [Kiloniella spongiae]